MEQMFHGHRYAFFLELNVFKSNLSKTIISFLRLSFKFTGIMYLLAKTLVVVILSRPILYQWNSPTERTVVERKPVNMIRTF